MEGFGWVSLKRSQGFHGEEHQTVDETEQAQIHRSVRRVVLGYMQRSRVWAIG